MMNNFKNFFNRFPFREETNKNYDIYSAKEFCRIIKRARARADRNDGIFSVAVFNVSDKNGYKVSSKKLVNCTKQRIRSTDVIGWFDASSIGVFLFNLSSDRAWQVAGDICRKTGIEAAPPFCRIFTYPYHYSSFKEDSADKIHEKKRGTFRKDSMNMRGETLPEAYFAGLQFQIDAEEDKENTQESTVRPVLGLEPFLGHSLPAWKRCMDIVGSLLGLILLLPFFLVITIFIRTFSPGPALFKQIRVGYLGKPFTFWKFRTMAVNADSTDHMNYVQNLITNGKPMSKLDDKNSQIIPFGRIFRKSCIDELPQLVNVLRGEMSLVGPRPCLPYEFQKYLLWHKQRFDILPGMTGLWQVKGKNRTTFSEMIRLDIAYEQRISFWKDLFIIFCTLPAIIIQMGDKFWRKGDLENAKGA
ncbi:MAG: hypothetical protein DRH24_12255 [Deltaproteobacteria bacterium]|nr:MAG: hypothetical protein DRH24_12255 [Deltaproteobacteria bacterium]